MLRLAIVEDDPMFRDQLQAFVERFEKDTGNRCSVSAFSDGAEIIQDYTPEFDIILMDIQMQQTDGMTAARAIRETDSDTVIVFITNSPQFAIEGYSVDALSYLLKPLSYYAFTQCLLRAAKKLRRKEKTYLFVNGQNGRQRIDSSELLYAEVHGHQMIWHTQSGDIVTPGAMKDAEESLAGLPFFRCSKCDLVNLAHVDSIRDGDAMVGTYRVQVSRAKKKPFMEALNRYLNEVQA